MNEAFSLLPGSGDADVLIVADHASNHVPDDVDLGIDPAMLNEHIAWDIGVGAIPEQLSARYRHAALLGSVSRLVTDYNRYPDEEAVMPPVSDGVDIPGNNLTADQRAARMDRFYKPFHGALAKQLDTRRPAFALFLHSFTPALMSDPDTARPWDVGILYNEDERAARIALDYLRAISPNVGDQLPYTGLIYNATMVRQAEARDIPYFCLEIRQDHIGDAVGAAPWADITQQLIVHVLRKLPG